ncbi:MAG: aldehyde dehydrogenase family protein [Streptosporangiaceae bacterium]
MSKTLAEWQQLADKIVVPADAYLDGSPASSVSGRRFTCTNPATGQELSRVSCCDRADVDAAVRSARRAYELGAWSRSPIAHRRKVLLRFADLIDEHADELALLDSLDMGKRAVDAHEFDLPFAAGLFRYFAMALDKLVSEVVPAAAGGTTLMARQPLGVVGAVIPWSYPVDMFAWRCAPALASGNSVVLKPAEQSPLSALRLAALLSEADLPDGVLNVVPGFGETAGRALGRHLDIDCIAFTGSTDVGKSFLGYAGESNMKQVWLEAGGKSAALVFADAADLDHVADLVCSDVFFNQGEACSSHSRLMVQRQIHDDLVDRILTRVSRYQPGDPLDPASGMGALVDGPHTQRVLRHIERACDSATWLCGGEQVTIGGSDCYITPAIFDGVAPGSELFQEEIFGPVLGISTFDEDDEAVRLANATSTGLSASVFTSDLARARRLARALAAATVSVNSIDALSARAPFAGFTGSGFGRDLSRHALDRFTLLKRTMIS